MGSDQPETAKPPRSFIERHAGWLGVLVAVALAIVFVRAVSGGDDPAPAFGSVGSNGAAPGVVRYYVDGTTTQASLTFQSASGTSQQNDVDVPLRMTATGLNYLEVHLAPRGFAYISAQNSKDTGTVTCEIRDNMGGVIASNSSSGAYAVVTCSGKAP